MQPTGLNLKKKFFKEDTQMANRHVQRLSASLIIREIKIKTTKRYHLTLVRMAIIKKLTNNKCWRGCQEKGTLLYCSVQFSHSVVSDFSRPHESQHASLPVHHQLPEFTQTHVHRVSDAIQPSHPLSSPSPPAPSPSLHQSLFQ